VFRIFDRYLWGQVLSSTLTGMCMLTGVMVLGNVYQKLDQLLGDAAVSSWVVVKFIALIIPASLIFTLPCAFLVGILLVYGRMSADNEIVALRMTGMPMWRICMPVFLMAVLLSGLCLAVNVWVAPMARNSIKFMFYEEATRDPANLFQEGRVQDKLPGMRIYTGKKNADGTLRNLHIIKLEGHRATEFISGRSAHIEQKPGTLDFTIHLKGANLETPEADETGAISNIKTFSAGETSRGFSLAAFKEKLEQVNPDMKDTQALFGELSSGLNSYVKKGESPQPLSKRDLSVVKTELNKRFSFSLACLTFCLVGIPLGITAQRRETTAGFVISLGVALCYFVFIMVADSMNQRPGNYPHLLMWAPNLLFLGIGSWLFRRMSQR
jgi:LPS export ABC transporter permease LptF